MAIGLAAVLVLCLSGCDQFLPDPLSFTVVDSTPIIRTCIPFTVNSERISVYASDKDYDGHTVWLATGAVAMDAGTEFPLAQPIEGLSVVQDDKVDFLSSRFKVELSVDTRFGGSWTTYSPFDPGQLQKDIWLDGSGNPVSVPCTHMRCSPLASCFNNWPQPTGEPTDSRPTFVPATPSPTPVPG